MEILLVLIPFILIGLLFRRKKAVGLKGYRALMAVNCPNCRTPIDNRATYCPHCAQPTGR